MARVLDEVPLKGTAGDKPPPYGRDRSGSPLREEGEGGRGETA